MLRASMNETNNGEPEEPGARELEYHSSSSSDDSEDPVVVQPSFDDQGAVDRSRSQPSDKSRDRQSRSPAEDGSKSEDSEERSPSSPSRRKQERRDRSHTRVLSALFSATTITDVMAGGPEQMVQQEVESGRKHRRIFSNDVTNPNLAHRRLDSGGQLAPVTRRHHRENSEGLDMLSLAATKEELATVAETGREETWEQHNTRPRPSLGQVSSTSSSYSRGPPPYGSHPNEEPPQHFQMEPPPQRLRVHYPPQIPPHLAGPYGHHYPPAHGVSAYHHFPPPPAASAFYGHYAGSGPLPHYPPIYAQMPPEYYKGGEYGRPPVEASDYERGTYPSRTEWEAAHRVSTSTEVGASANHQGVQTSLSSITAGGKVKNAGTNTDRAHPPVPGEVGHHHRKLSSFSSLGTLLGSSLFPAPTTGSGGSDEEAKKKKKHHRSSSSSVSFLNGLVEAGLSEDNFLKNLQAANNASANAAYRSSPPPDRQQAASSYRSSPPDAMPRLPVPKQLESFQESDSSDPEDVSSSPRGGTKLAEGGTSKRVRRKCTQPGCANRVVQGGLCISHGAKRKTCKHAGCNKNVKKAGLCSTHGPARKRCEQPDCGKVAVQGGRCIAHGAKKKLCCVEDCTKQAILSGMCKKHHDQEQLQKNSLGGEYCKPTAAGAADNSHKPRHTRGLSIFQEMSADAVSSLLGDAKHPDASPNLM